MKKIITVTLALALLLGCLCACGSSPSIAAAEKILEEASSASEETAPAKEPAAEEPEEEFSVGSSDGSVYTNEFFGWGFSLDSSLELFTDEQIAEVNEAAMDAVSEDYAELMSQQEYFYDMMASDTQGRFNINIIVQNLTLAQAAIISEKSALESSLSEIETSFAAAGMDIVSMEVSTIDFLGKEHACLILEADYSGNPIYETEICVRKGTHMAFIAITSILEDHTQEVMDRFYGL